MRLKSKLQKWQEQGFINEAQRADILSFEQAKTSRHFAFGMQLCGGFAVILGFALIIAANWHELGRYAKLGGHFALSGLVSLWLFKTGYDRAKPVLQEILTIVLFGLNLTFIALIGQVFQLDGELHQALLIWMILSAPTIILYARAGFTAWLWIIAFYVSANIIFVGFSEGLGVYNRFMLGYFLSLFIPLGFYADHHLRFTKTHRPAFADCFRISSLFVMVITASISSVMYYGGAEEFFEEAPSGFLHFGYVILIPVLALLYIAALRKIFVHNGEDYDWGVLAICAAFMGLAFILPIDSSVFAALHFIGLWVVMGLWAQRHHVMGVINLAIALVAIRLYIIFLELFGDALMDTGLGLIIAGGVMIGFVSAAKKFRGAIIKGMKASKEAS